MNIRTFYSLNFNVFNELRSEKIGIYFSFLLHAIILLFAIGAPNFFRPDPIQIPSVIPIEIINVSDTTSITKEIKPTENNETKKIITEPKKFNKVEKQEIKKIEMKPTENNETKKIITEPKKFNKVEKQEIQTIKMKTKPEKIIKENKEEKFIKEEININENSKNLLELKDNQKVLEEEIIESLPSKKIRPKIKPKPKNLEFTTQVSSDIKVKNKLKPQTNFNINSMLKDLRYDQKTFPKIPNENKKIKDNKELNQNEDEVNETVKLSISEIDLLVQQLAACWSAPAGAKIENWMIITVKARIKRDRTVFQESVRIVDTNIPKSNPFYEPITESAMRTLLNPECNPLKLPEDKYDLWKDFKINFDLRLMRGYQ